MEALIDYNAEARKVLVSYPWTEDVCRLADNMGQAIAFQSSVERRLLKDRTLMDTYNRRLLRFIAVVPLQE